MGIEINNLLKWVIKNIGLIDIKVRIKLLPCLPTLLIGIIYSIAIMYMRGIIDMSYIIDSIVIIGYWW